MGLNRSNDFSLSQLAKENPLQLMRKLYFIKFPTQEASGHLLLEWYELDYSWARPWIGLLYSTLYINYLEAESGAEDINSQQSVHSVKKRFNYSRTKCKSLNLYHILNFMNFFTLLETK